MRGFFSSIADELFREGSQPPKTGPRRVRAPAVAARYPLVAQDDETGCGVACIAMLAGRDYAEVRAKLFTSKRKRVFYTTYKDMRRGLGHFGLALDDGRARRFTSFADVPSTAIAAVEQSPPSKAHWHWVVFVREPGRRYVLDPSWDGIVRTDLRGLKGRTFLAVIDGRQEPGRRRAASPHRPRTAKPV